VKLTEIPIPGAYLIEYEPFTDERGWFARTFDSDVLATHGLEPAVVQCSTSFNARAGTLRGMHWQEQPHGEVKHVRCTRGAIFDVIVDLRKDSPSYCRWFGVELTPDNGRAFYIPVDVAHGFQTLEDASEVSYQMSYHYVPEAARGVRFDDPAFGIDWPEPPGGNRQMSERDRTYPDFVP
jgi:dTDP-4-dehydrorhamnose 3,5-epimerase